MQDIPKIFTAIAEWSACLVFVLTLEPRFSKAKIAGIMAGVLAVLSVLQVYIGIWPDVFWIPSMFVAMMLMYLCILVCCNVNLLDCGLYWAMAFIAGEFIASFEWQIYAFFARSKNWTIAFEYGFMILFYLSCFGIFYMVQRWMSSKGNKFDVSAKGLLGCLMMTLAVFFE